jgi:hypothetical protein
MNTMRKGKDQHVMPAKDGWGVKGEGNSRFTRLAETKSEAEKIAKTIAKHQHSEVVIHNRDGVIRDSDSYGNDPRRSKDRVH